MSRPRRGGDLGGDRPPSERLRKYQSHPYWAFIADQAWLAGE
jgi:hypothetical protein